MKLFMVAVVLFSLAEKGIPECPVGEYFSTYRGYCSPCYYYCSFCEDGGYCRVCPEECGCDSNCTSIHEGCDLRACGGCVDGYDYNLNGYCVCQNTLHCCEDDCAICGGPGNCKECVPGKYGSICINDCPSNCTKCTSYDTCTECIPGYYGPQCTDQCRKECTKCLNYDKCTECIDGRYGPNCSEICRKECTSCTGFNNCTSCIPGRYGTTCGNTCRNECVACTNYDNCIQCVDGKYDYKCESACLTGCKVCTNGYSCIECKPGKYGSRCTNNCNAGCKESLCDKSTARCTKGCADGYYVNNYDKRCSKCNYGCTKCIEFANCSECMVGRFGSLCHLECSGCKNGLCEKTSGACIAGCEDPEKFYPKPEGGCEACPENCIRCTSDTSCSECITGKYGPGCQNSCIHCKDNLCESDTGYCTIGCVEGYYINRDTNRCSQCPYGCVSCTGFENCTLCKSESFWGPNCLYYCDNCLDGCDKDQGCTAGCNNGYFQNYNTSKGGLVCNQCPDSCDSCTGADYDECTSCEMGHWGLNCDNRCSGCKNNECDRYNGCTDGCKTGYFITVHENSSYCELCPDNCQNCSSNYSCSDCEPEFYGIMCENACSSYNGDCAVCSGKDEDSFKCLECLDNYYVVGRNVCQVCPDNCEHGPWPYCNPVNGICYHGCQNNLYWGLQCQHSCTGCRFSTCDRTLGCIYGCLNDYFLTSFESQFHCELCPENCKSCFNTSSCSNCNLGFYGEHCEYSCRRRDESCITCTGKTLESFKCTECEEGTYPGPNYCQACNMQCSHGPIPLCNPTTGSCYHGCQKGWVGDRCGIEQCAVNNCETCEPSNPYSCLLCEREHYKLDAETCKRCPENCLSTCDSISGSCSEGCKDGWTGEKCDQKCKSRCIKCDQTNVDICEKCQIWFFGDTCENSCSINCRESTESRICDKETGYCLSGCKSGIWGQTCSTPCSDGCKDEMCDALSGVCLRGCKDGTWGRMCILPCSEGCRGNVCEETTGTCLIGCKTGFDQLTCIPDSNASRQKGSRNDSIVVGLSAGIGALVVVAAVAIALVFILLKRSRRNEMTQPQPGNLYLYAIPATDDNNARDQNQHRTAEMNNSSFM